MYAQGFQNSVTKNFEVQKQNPEQISSQQLRNYRNLLSTLLKRAEEKYFTNFFNENIKDIKKAWKGIKTLVSMKQKNNDTPSLNTEDE